MDIVFWFFAIAFVIFLIVAMPRYDGQRIREQVAAHGGKVIEISSRWFGSGSRYGRTYDVTYETRHGKQVTATCVTSMMRGVQWLSDRPPGSDMETSEAGGWSGRSEAIDCMACGAKIPAGKTRCPHCGWSYEEINSAKTLK
jgi:hypothetical protein